MKGNIMSNPVPPGWSPAPPTVQQNTGPEPVITNSPTQWAPYVSIPLNEYEALVKGAQQKAPPAWWAAVTKWVASKHWSFHTLLVAYPVVAGVIVGNPQAHAAWLDLWAHAPHWLVDVVVIGGPVVALLVTGNKGTPPPA
jgi:hypothetical protein